MKRIAIFAGAAAAIILVAAAGSDDARADERSAYCHDYADDAARSRSGGQAFGTTVGGAAMGAVLGAILGGGEGAARGAMIGGGSGLFLGAIGEASNYERTYDRAFADCMHSYNPPRHDTNAASYNQHGGGQGGYSPEPWTPEWYDYCSDKYRSFDPNSGYYLAYSGNYRFCQ